MKTIYVSCPAYSYTGGPTLAHQLCYVLNIHGFNAKMLYYGRITRKSGVEIVHPNYVIYGNKYVVDVTDNEDAIIVAPETFTGMLRKYKKALRVVWWMSVDNYYMSMGSFVDTILRKLKIFNPDINYCKKYAKRKKYQVIQENDVKHLTQSEYAKEFLVSQGIKQNAIFRLSDYIEDSMMNATINKNVELKMNKVLYNPKKGFEFTEKIIHLTSDIEWVPLANMTKEQMVVELITAKLYIDFGNHPGKDRIPREAAISGCCIITGRKGSADNNVDVCILDEYKFEDIDENLSIICEKIIYVLKNYEACYADFASYRDVIRKEKEIFIQDAIYVFSQLVCSATRY